MAKLELRIKSRKTLWFYFGILFPRLLIKRYANKPLIVVEFSDGDLREYCYSDIKC